LFNVSFFRHAAGLHASLIGAPFPRALFRSLCEGWSYVDAAYNGGGDKQAILNLHIHSPDLCLLTRHGINSRRWEVIALTPRLNLGRPVVKKPLQLFFSSHRLHSSTKPFFQSEMDWSACGQIDLKMAIRLGVSFNKNRKAKGK
jgi:hypothetical protein